MGKVAVRQGEGSRLRVAAAMLLALVMLLVQGLPGAGSPAKHAHAGTSLGHGVAGATAQASAARGAHGEAPCSRAGLHDDGSCCSVAQCIALHGGLPAEDGVAFPARLDRIAGLESLPMPEGIGTDPALRPPSSAA
jgi:hypothetical protein